MSTFPGHYEPRPCSSEEALNTRTVIKDSGRTSRTNGYLIKLLVTCSKLYAPVDH